MVEGQSLGPRDWVQGVQEFPGVVEDDMSRQNVERKLGTTGGSRGRSRPARATRISRRAAKSRRARQRGRWGRISVEGGGHYNPVRSEGPWGRAAGAARTAVLHRVAVPDSERGAQFRHGEREGWKQTSPGKGYAGSELDRSHGREGSIRKAGLEAVLGKTRRTEF